MVDKTNKQQAVKKTDITPCIYSVCYTEKDIKINHPERTLDTEIAYCLG